MVNIDSLHTWFLDSLDKKKTFLNIIQNCDDVNEKKKLQITFNKKFCNLPDEFDYLYSILQLEKLKTDESITEDEKNRMYYEFVKKHFSRVLDIETLTLIKRGGLSEDELRLKKERDTHLRCKNCDAEGQLVECENIFVCIQCGFCLDALIMAPSWDQEKDLPKRKSGYTKQKTFSEAIDYYLCRKKCTISNENIVKLQSKLQHISLEHLTIKMLKCAMKELNMNKIYMQIYLIFFQLTNKKVIIDPSTEKIIHYLFYLVKEAFADLRTEKKIHRTNIFIYKYSIFKILEIIICLAEIVKKNRDTTYLIEENEHEYQNKQLTRQMFMNINTQQLKFAISMIPFPVIESEENFIKYDEDWYAICERCNLPFFESL